MSLFFTLCLIKSKWNLKTFSIVSHIVRIFTAVNTVIEISRYRYRLVSIGFFQFQRQHVLLSKWTAQKNEKHTCWILFWFQQISLVSKQWNINQKNIFNAIQFGALDFTSTVLTFKRIYWLSVDNQL